MINVSGNLKFDLVFTYILEWINDSQKLHMVNKLPNLKSINFKLLLAIKYHK